MTNAFKKMNFFESNECDCVLIVIEKLDLLIFVTRETRSIIIIIIAILTAPSPTIKSYALNSLPLVRSFLRWRLASIILQSEISSKRHCRVNAKKCITLRTIDVSDISESFFDYIIINRGTFVSMRPFYARRCLRCNESIHTISCFVCNWCTLLLVIANSW